MSNGCGRSDLDAIRFKEDYEALNKTTNLRGDEYRHVTISKSNPFVYTSARDIINKIAAGETFYVYFGSKLCPWCRSVIEKAIESAAKYDIDKIYYVDIWDEDGNEILRDKYTLKDDEIEIANEGSKEYFELLKHFDNVLGDYTLTNTAGDKVYVGEKRIYAPTFVRVENGIAMKMATGISDKQTDSRAVLTDDILADEEKEFAALFSNMCESAC